MSERTSLSLLELLAFESVVRLHLCLRVHIIEQAVHDRSILMRDAIGIRPRDRIIVQLAAVSIRHEAHGSRQVLRRVVVNEETRVRLGRLVTIEAPLTSPTVQRIGISSVRRSRTSRHREQVVVFFRLGITVRRGTTVDTPDAAPSASCAHGSVMEGIVFPFRAGQLRIQRPEDCLESALGRGSVCRPRRVLRMVSTLSSLGDLSLSLTSSKASSMSESRASFSSSSSSVLASL